MKTIINFSIFLLGISVLVAATVFAFTSGKSLAELYATLSPDFAAGIILISVVAVLCTLILSRSVYSMSSAKDKNILPEKSIVYQNFIGLSTRLGLNEGDDDRSKYNMEDQHRQMMLWASDSVLKEYLKLQKVIDADGEVGKQIDQMERVILAMRRDLGYNNAMIVRGDLNALINKASLRKREAVEA